MARKVRFEVVKSSIEPKAKRFTEGEEFELRWFGNFEPGAIVEVTRSEVRGDYRMTWREVWQVRG